MPVYSIRRPPVFLLVACAFALLASCGQHLAFLRERGLAFSSQQDLQTLGELLGVHFTK